MGHVRIGREQEKRSSKQESWKKTGAWINMVQIVESKLYVFNCVCVYTHVYISCEKSCPIEERLHWRVVRTKYR